MIEGWADVVHLSVHFNLSFFPSRGNNFIYSNTFFLVMPEIKRRFIVLGHRCRTDGRFTLEDLPGSTGRLDILLRCVNSAFMLSHSIRKDVEAVLILCNENKGGEKGEVRTVRLLGPEIKYLNPDERSTGALVRNALIKFIHSPEEEPRSSPGITISSQGLEEVIQGLGQEEKLVYLHEDGEAAEEWLSSHPPESTLNFVMSDNIDLHQGEEELVRKRADGIISLGPVSLHSDHCIVLANNILDRIHGCHGQYRTLAT